MQLLRHRPLETDVTRLLASIAILLALAHPSDSFVPQRCSIPSQRRLAAPLSAALLAGDRVLVIGGTSGVGQLVSQKLLARGGPGDAWKVRVAARNVDRAREILSNDSMEFVPLDLVAESESSLDRQLDNAMKDVAAVVVSVGTTAFPTQKWKGGNTPAAIDREAVRCIAEAAGRTATLKKIILLTSVGVDRTKEMPFLILNLFGVLDAKRDGEEAVKASAREHGFDYVIVRPGRLVGGPFTNLDVAKLLNTQGGATNGVQVSPGDTLLGDCKRDACAEAIVQCLANEACSNLEFSIISTDKEALTDEQWEATFQRLQA